MFAKTQLPAEVLQLIFSLITQRDKLECMTVCRHWHDIIFDHCLFRAVSLYHQRQLDQLIERVKRDPLLGKKVERIAVQFKLEPDYDEEVFIELFPHVRHFALVNTEGTPRNSKSMALQQSHPWSEHIETLVDFDSDFITNTLIPSGTCKNLTHLTVRGHMNIPARPLIKALVNTPSLKELQLLSYQIKFMDLELLHETTPILTSLSLKDIYLEDNKVSHNVKPATSIKKFQFIISNTLDYIQSHPHVDYITQKYTHLEELALNIEWIYVYGNESSWGDSKWDSRHMEVRTMMLAYLKALAPSLKSFEYQRIYEGYIRFPSFEWNFLDLAGCQLKRLCFDDYLDSPAFELLSTTTQAQYIQSLKIKMTMDDVDTDDEDDDEDDDGWNRLGLIPGVKVCSFEYYSFSLEWLNRFTVLKELTIEFSLSKKYDNQQYARVEQLFDALSNTQLETLSLKYADLRFERTSRIYAYPSLKSLTLYNVALEDGTDVFISQSFPNLKHLSLIGCSGLSNWLMLPRLNLSHLKISKKIEKKPDEEPRHALVITLDNNQQRLYTTSEIPFSVRRDAEDVEKSLISFSSALSEPYTGSMETPFLTVVCGSLHEFSLLNGHF